jgi:hypothetical protein
MIVLVALGVNLDNMKPTQCIVVDIALHGKYSIRTLHALLDTGA